MSPTPFQNLTGLYCTLLHRNEEIEGQIVHVYGRLLEIRLVEDRKLTTYRHYGELPVQVWNLRSSVEYVEIPNGNGKPRSPMQEQRTKFYAKLRDAVLGFRKPADDEKFVSLDFKQQEHSDWMPGFKPSDKGKVA